MNNNPIINIPVSTSLAGKEHHLVKLTSTGIALAGAGDRVIGKLERASTVRDDGSSAVGDAAAVALIGCILDHVTIGNNVAIAMGDELESWPSGRVIKRGGVITGTAEADDNLITVTNHGFTAGQAVVFTSLTGGAGLTAGVTYYVIATGLTANVFSVATTSGGSAVDITTDYSALSVRPATAGTIVGLGFEAAGSNSIGGQVRALLFSSASEGNGGVEVLTAARTLTAADNGKTFFLALAGGFTVTLPAHAPGLKFTFWAKVSPTTAYIIAAPSGAEDTIVGWPSNIGGADSVADGNAAGDQLAFVANTALAGDYAELISDGSVWYAKAHAKAINAIAITG